MVREYLGLNCMQLRSWATLAEGNLASGDLEGFCVFEFEGPLSR